MRHLYICVRRIRVRRCILFVYIYTCTCMRSAYVCVLCAFLAYLCVYLPRLVYVSCALCILGFSWWLLVVVCLLLWFYPQYWFIDLLIYCYTGVYWFIDLLIYCYTGLLLLVVSIGFQKPLKFAVPCVFCCLLYNYDLSFSKMRNSRDFKPYFSFWL